MESWYRAAGLRDDAVGYDFMLKKAVVEWESSATAGDLLVITVEVARWGTTSFDVSFVGCVGERAVFAATITYVGVRFGTTDPVPPPPSVRDRLTGPE
jgi:acyl-CoA thioester hydrolase